MNFTPVESSNIAGIAYDGEGTLHVQFKNGSIYAYQGVPPEKHDELMNAGSVGSHFNAHIKGNYEYERVQ